MLPDTYLTPYLSFDGNAKEAMEFYHKALGGKLEMSPYGKLMGEGLSEADKSKIMHAMITNDHLSIMGSDNPPGTPYQAGSNISISIAGTNAEKLKKFWDELSQGGQITKPMEKQVWGDEFGMFTDKFGIHWMINIAAQEQSRL